MSVQSEVLGTDEDGRPTVTTALGAHFMLRKLSTDDEGPLEEAHARIIEWFAPKLRWAASSFDPEIVPFRPALFDYATGVAANIPTKPTAFDALTAPFQAYARDAFFLDVSGGADDLSASPWSYRFFSEVPDTEKLPLDVFASMSITVPLEEDPDGFATRMLEIARLLQPQWANIGPTYSRWSVAGVQEVEAAVHRHCRRYLGFDAGFFVRHLPKLHDKIRSVNWVTIIGPRLAPKVVGEPSGDLTGWTLDDLLVLKAGARPEAGDRNRLQVPRAYVQADRLVRAVRSSHLDAARTPGPWSDATLDEWLRRFERTYN